MRWGWTVPVLLLALVACGGARRIEPLAGPPELASRTEVEGRKLYLENCDPCHPSGEAGLGPALSNKPLFAFRLQIRNGLGAMPAFPESRLSDEDVSRIIAYVRALHGREAPPELVER